MVCHKIHCEHLLTHCERLVTVFHFSIYSYVCRTDPADVARVESKTFICTPDKYRTVPHVKPGVQGILGQWKSPEEADKHLQRFNGCMAGKALIKIYLFPLTRPTLKKGPTQNNLFQFSVKNFFFNFHCKLSERIVLCKKCYISFKKIFFVFVNSLNICN